MLETVKIQGQGYLLNGTISVPMADGNSEYEAIKQWLSEGNTPEPEFTAEALAQQELNKQKAGQIIESKYNIFFWQLNHPRLDTSYSKQYEWIDNIRAICNKAELEGTELKDIEWVYYE